MYACTYVYVYIYVCIYVCIYTCVCVCVCMHNGISAILNEILPFSTTWTDWDGFMFSEISQTEKETYSMSSLTCGI